MCYCVDSSRLAASLLERTMVAPVFFCSSAAIWFAVAVDDAGMRTLLLV